MPRKRSDSVEYVTLHCEVLRTTDKAVLVELNGEEVWIPRSQCEGGDDIDEGDDSINVTRWFADKRGLTAA